MRELLEGDSKQSYEPVCRVELQQFLDGPRLPDVPGLSLYGGGDGHSSVGDGRSCQESVEDKLVVLVFRFFLLGITDPAKRPYMNNNPVKSV